MRDKINNIIIYAHFAQNHFRTHLNGLSIREGYNFNEFKNHGAEYLQEKVKRYLGKTIRVEEIDHNQILSVWLNKPSIAQLEELTKYFIPFIGRLSTANNIVPETEVLDSNGNSVGIIDQFFSVHGADFTLNNEIQSYINDYKEEEWIAVIRNLKLNNITE